MTSAHNRSTASPRRGCWSPAPPASPAPWRRRSSGATRGCELVAATSRSDAGKRLDELYPRYRVPLELTELDLDDRLEGIDAAIVAYPHGAAAPTVAALRAQGILVVDLSADFRLRDMRDLRALVRRARRPRPLRHRRLRADRDLPRGAARGEAGRHPRLLPDRERAGAGAAGRSRACSPRSSSPRCRAPPATAAAATTSSTSPR